MSKHKALELADSLGSRVVRNWTHATGETPRASGYRPDNECQQAAATIRAQHALIVQMREALKDAADQARHPDYDWPIWLSNQTDAALAAADQYLKGEQA